MANLTVTVGTLSATTPNINNTKAQEIINDYIAANNGPVNGTNQEKLDWYVRELAKHTKSVANAQGILTRVKAEEDAAKTEIASRDWA